MTSISVLPARGRLEDSAFLRESVLEVEVWVFSRIAEPAALPSCPAISTGPLPSFPLPSLASLTPCSQIAQLQRCEPITEEVKQLCLKAREILIEEGNVQVVDSPVTVRRVAVVSSTEAECQLDMR